MQKAQKSDLFQPNDVYNNRFIIVKKIGKGGQATAYLAFDKQKKNNIALKIAKPEYKQKILTQYQLIKSLNHPNIIKVYSSQDNYVKGIKYFFIIMEYVEGGDLQVFLGKLDEKEIQRIYHQVKEVIRYLHSKGIIHRDLTISNILLDAKKNVKVIDFGITTLLEQNQTHIGTSFIKGNRLYRPQQLVQDFIVSKQNDLWQFGITLIELVTGKEIKQLANKMPYSIKNFPEQVFKKYKVNKKFRAMIFSLLRNQYKDRKFCQDIFFVQPILYETTLQLVCPDCFLIDQTGKIIALFGNLKKLIISGNNLTDEFIYNIESVLPSLITLKLAFTNIRDESMSLITKKSLMLEQLDISYTLVTSAGIIMLTKLTKLSSLTIWSGQYQYPQRYEDIINHGNNQGKCKYNNITINQQCVKELRKLNLTEICINADGTDIDQLILRMRKQSICVQVRGKMNSKVVEYICEMEKLQEVYLYEVKEFEIKEFRSKQLRSCGLVDCKIDKKKLIKYLAKCDKLTSLDLQYNNIGKQGVIEIAKNMKSLTSLNIGDNNIGKQGAIEIAKNMKSLTSLNLNNNNIGKQGVIQIAKNMKSLTSLNLWGNDIGNQGAIEIAKNMKSLTSLDLCWNNIGKQGAIEIAKNMKSLTSLDLRNNNIGNQGAIEIAKNMKSLTSLNLSQNNIGDQGVIKIAKNMKSLTSLDLYGNNIGKQGAIEIAKNMKSLTSLNLNNNNIGRQGVIQIAKNMKSLTSLDLCWNNIGKQGAIEIAKNMKSLTSLNLRNNNIGKQGAIQIAKNMKSLTSLDLCWNNIGKQGAIQIAKNMKSLTSLDLGGNNNIDNDTKQLIKKIFPTISIYI